MKSGRTWVFRTPSTDITNKCCDVIRQAARALNAPGVRADQAPYYRATVPLNPPVAPQTVRSGPRGADIARCGYSQPLKQDNSRKLCDVCFEQFDVKDVPDRLHSSRHGVCLPCLKNAVLVSIGTGARDVPCVVRCGQNLAYTEIKWLSGDDPLFKG